MTPDFKEIKEMFSTNERALNVLYLLVDAKPCVRLMANESELAKIEKFCNKNNIWVDTSDFKVAIVKDKTKAGYSNKGLVVPVNSPIKGEVVIYMSKNEMLVRHAKKHEKDQDTYKLGLDLGYPDCCCEFFLDNKKEQSAKNNDFVMPALKNSTMDVFPYQLNNALRYFDKVVLPHFPCSYDCEKSMQQAKNFMQVIDAYTDLGTEFMDSLKSPVVYTENEGVFRLKNASFNNKDLEVSYKGAEGTMKNELFQLLNHANRIVIKNRNFLKVYRGEHFLHEINNPNYAVLLFE